MSIAPPAPSSNIVRFESNGPLFAAIPLHPGCKIPINQGWQLTAPGTYPSEGHHGQSIPDGVLVIDFDPKNFPEGRNVLDELWDAHLANHDTRRVQTPSGGWHFYYKVPMGTKFAQKQAAWPGVDFKMKPGQVVAPGSVLVDGKDCNVPGCNQTHVAGPYVLKNDVPMQDCPASLLALLKAKEEPVRAEPVEASLLGEPDFIIACQAYPAAVQGENGDDRTYALACKGRDLGLPQESTYRVMAEHFNERCEPKWSEHDLRAKVKHAYRYAKNTAGALSPEAKFIPPPPVPTALTIVPLPPVPSDQEPATKIDKPSPSERVAASVGNVEYWQDPDGVAYASKIIDGHWVHYPVVSKAFRKLVEYTSYKMVGKPPTEQSVKDAIRSMGARARFDGDEHRAWLRVAETGGKIYLDLCNKDWQAVEISSDGWCVIDNPPVRFVRSETMQPLPIPEQAGPEALAELRDLLNFEDSRSWSLFLSFLVSCLRPGGPFPICFLSGAKGSAKSTVLRVIRKLVDPTGKPDRRAPKEFNRLDDSSAK